MFNLFEIWVGTDKYSFEKLPYNYRHQINVDEADIPAYQDICDAKLENKEILWYLITLTTFDPQTGESTTQTWHKAGQVAQKIYINPAAKQIFKPKKATLGDWFDAPVEVTIANNTSLHKRLNLSASLLPLPIPFR